VNRRNLIIVLGSTAVAPHMAFAQSKQAPVLIGWLGEGSRQAWAHRLDAFKEGLTALGWKEGANFVLEERWAEGRYERLQPLAEALAANKPAIIVAGPSLAVAAAAKAAPKIPIVVASGDPLAAGLVSNLARPSGMITGVTNIVTQVNQKHLELLLDAVPKLRRIGFLVDSNSPTYALMMEARRRSVVQFSVEGVFAEVARAEEIDAAISRLAKEGVHALVVTASPIFLSERKRIAKLAAVHRWPFVVGQSEFAEDGALLTYGADRSALFRRAAYYVDKILKGARPGDLPIEQPTKFELVVNLKTAKALGITIPQSILVRADRVIE
jgi:putative ABC transport system substrate-binding protein